MLAETTEWLAQAEYDIGTAESLYQIGTAESLYQARRYIYTIFMCHLAVEKGLKALLVEKTGKAPPKIIISFT